MVRRCAQQKSWGKCGESWMKGYCCRTCFNCQGTGCGSGPSPPGPSPSPPGPPPGPGLGVHFTTCHSDSECGSTCGSTGSDTASPTEGIFGTSCSCQSPGLTTVCTKEGKQVSKCSDGRAPNCRTACGQKICNSMSGKKATATIRSACPLHHHQNVDDCCSKGGQYCTCVLEENIDLNWKPYGQIGGHNGYGQAYMGACGSELFKLNISIATERASRLIQPFLKDGAVCKADELARTASPAPLDAECSDVVDRDQCGHLPGCAWCEASKGAAPVSPGCFNFGEAEVLKHVMATERGADAFKCGLELKVEAAVKAV